MVEVERTSESEKCLIERNLCLLDYSVIISYYVYLGVLGFSLSPFLSFISFF